MTHFSRKWLICSFNKDALKVNVKATGFIGGYDDHSLLALPSDPMSTFRDSSPWLVHHPAVGPDTSGVFIIVAPVANKKGPGYRMLSLTIAISESLQQPTRPVLRIFWNVQFPSFFSRKIWSSENCKALCKIMQFITTVHLETADDSQHKLFSSAAAHNAQISSNFLYSWAGGHRWTGPRGAFIGGCAASSFW